MSDTYSKLATCKCLSTTVRPRRYPSSFPRTLFHGSSCPNIKQETHNRSIVRTEKPPTLKKPYRIAHLAKSRLCLKTRHRARCRTEPFISPLMIIDCTANQRIISIFGRCWVGYTAMPLYRTIVGQREQRSSSTCTTRIHHRPQPFFRDQIQKC